MIGLALVVVFLLRLWGTDHWRSTRTFKPVDVPISVDTEKAETGNFLINVSGKFLISIEHGEKAENSLQRQKLSWSVDFKCEMETLSRR